MNNRFSLHTPILLALLAAAGCSDSIESSMIDSSTRISIAREPVQFASDGTTPDGEYNWQAAVTIVQGNKINKLDWDFEVDDPKGCATVTKADVITDFIGTYEGDSRPVTEKGLNVTVQPNPEYRRYFTITVTAQDGTTRAFTFSQLGEKADASVSSNVKDIEFIAAGGEQTIAYTTNMGDEYLFDAEYEGTSSGWLEWSATESGSVDLKASAWTDKDNVRNAVFLVIVGSPDTSTDTLRIPVTQLAADEYYYMYGSSASGLDIAGAVQMTKIEKGLHSVKGYFMNAADGANKVLFNMDSRTFAYPYFALAKDGTVAKVESASSALPEGPEIDVDGMRNLTVNFNDMTWTWERITTNNCMPDEELSKYRTKSFIARDGTMKEWMVEHMRWDGGGIIPKLGARMVPSAATATGGYSSDSVMPQSWDDASRLNMAYEEAEIGGQLQGDDTHGRIYAYSEIITGTPTWGLDNKINQTFPEDWTAGSVITDAVGDEITLEYISNPGGFTGDNEADEKAHPMVTMQVQGICPYGWHIANLSDWLDIAYAASQASEGHTFKVLESQCTYKQLTTASGTGGTGDKEVSARGIGNLAAWLRNTEYWTGATYNNISDGADEFGFNYYPLGFRYMKQGYQMAGLRCQMWIPLYTTDKRAFRMNVVIKNHNSSYTEATYVDNGNAILPFRCVRNYKTNQQK